MPAMRDAAPNPRPLSHFPKEIMFLIKPPSWPADTLIEDSRWDASDPQAGHGEETIMSNRRKFESEEMDLKLLEVTEDPAYQLDTKKAPPTQVPAPVPSTVAGASKKARVLH